MGKRSNFERKGRDYYPTPLKPVQTLVPFLPQERFTFWEPCAGDGRLITHLQTTTSGVPTFACDIEPQESDWNILRLDVLSQDDNLWEYNRDVNRPDYIITNPPWNVKLLHPMIDKFRGVAPTWLLFYADWAHTKRAAPYLEYCSDIVPVGRVKWIEDSPHSGKDNTAWYCFHAEKKATIFHPNVA